MADSAQTRFSPETARAFTLVELLAVIAIVGVLVAITVPVVGNMRRAARTTECASNMRQLHNAIMLQAQDNRGVLIMANDNTTGVRWFQGELNAGGVGKSALSPYVGGGDALQRLSVCPENRTEDRLNLSNPRNDYGYPYVVNYYVIVDFSSTKRVRLNQITNPARLVMMTDSNTGSAWGNAGFGPPTNPSWSRIAEPHGGRTNILWCDGHVTLQPKSEIEDCVFL